MRLLLNGVFSLKSLLTVGLLAASFSRVVAEPVHFVQGGDAEVASVPAAENKEFIRRPGGGRAGSTAFELTVPESHTTGRVAERATFPELIPVDPAKTYRLEGWLRSADQENPASADFGVIMYDENKRAIKINSVAAKADSGSELLEAAEKGATQIVVARSESWLSLSGNVVAFGAKNDLSDLPNFSISPRIKSVEARGDKALVATLAGPLNASYTAGTKVRLHAPWGAHLYWIAKGWVPAEWQRYETVLSGEAASGTPKDAFWKGTRWVRVFVQLGNWNYIPKKGARLLFDDISFAEIAPVTPARTE